MTAYILVIDQGTTTSRAVVFDAQRRIVGMGRMDLTQHHPAPDWGEHVPEEIWATCLWAAKTALRKAGITADQLAGISITNQRETTLVWDRATGKPIYNAIVWHDQRTANLCRQLRKAGVENRVRQRTGLMLAPYFSATKIKWILDHVKGARRRARRGELAFGTVDTWLIWRLTGGLVHATDATNASRTQLYDLKSNSWHNDLLDLFDVPQAMLPEVRDSADEFGSTDPAIFGAAVPIRGVVGDQQASLVGQGCFLPGMIKSTYGTSCFALVNTGEDCVISRNRLLTTVAYRVGGKSTYALEGAIITTGGALRWLRDDVGLVEDWDEVNALASAADPQEAVYLVPAFSGLGAPWWDDEARGAYFGLTRNTRRPELVRAALEAVGYQSADMFDAMRRDLKTRRDLVLRVDGGMVASDWTMQFLADILDLPVDCTNVPEVSSYGAAWLTAWKTGLWPDAVDFDTQRPSRREFAPQMAPAERRKKLRGWHAALQKVLTQPSK